MAAQFLTISKLSNIINMIALGQQSGILRVVRGQGAQREIGQIKFLNGQPASALLGQLTGASALAVLQNWGECVYAFEEMPPGELGDLDLPSDSMGRTPSDPNYSLNSGALPSGSWPAYSFPSAAPHTPPAVPSQGNVTHPLPGSISQPGYYPQASSGYQTGYPGQGDAGYGGAGRGYPGQAPGGDAINPQALLLRPRRTNMAERVDQLPLDRRERMVLLLVDGQRTMADLARLTRRSERELLAVLDYLAGLGLVELRG